MFGQTFFTLLTVGLWTDPAFSHGPIVLMIALYLLLKRWAELSRLEPYAPSSNLGIACLILSAALLIAGKDLEIIYVELLAFVLALIGIVATVAGLDFLRRLKFPLFFMVFMIPLPGFIAVPISRWFKLLVSDGTVNILRELQYPVARSGVIIQIGQYQLLVADACAGLRTLFMLEALGVLYLHLVRHPSLLRVIILPILIVPISFLANVFRVVILALITYHFGDKAGQGYLHWLAGVVLFLVGLTMLIIADALLRLLSKQLHPS
jgi:exosortase B